ncbi:MAG TPA: hypothetical protein VHT92_01985, partial [Candidatus Cybelea sp.]|nr:hypothetical protein [Candidatus Cybelea sp.]
MKGRTLLVTSVVAVAVSACGGGSANEPGPSLPYASPQSPAIAANRTVIPLKDPARGKIQHVVIVVQENRSFNNLFYGFPGAKTATYGYNSSGQKIELQPVVLETPWDIEHDSYGFEAACNGTGSIPGTNCQMNG